MSDVAHTNVTVITVAAPYEQYHFYPHNPFLSQSHLQKIHLVNEA